MKSIPGLDRLTLYEWQLEDLERLTSDDQYPHKLICWDMGTGKTRMGIAMDLVYRAKNKGGKTLVIAPTTAVMNVWMKNFGLLTDLKVFPVDPKNRDGSFATFMYYQCDVLITHWAAVQLLKDDLKKVNWLHIIADESHKISDRKSNTTVSLKQIKAKHKTAMTGTPGDGHPQKLYSILNWLYPKVWSNHSKFIRRYCDFIVTDTGYKKFNGPMNIPHLHKQIKPYYSVHFKRRRCCKNHPKGVGEHMPAEPIEDEMFVTMTPAQTKQYKEMKKDTVAWLYSLATDELDPLVAQNAVAKLTRLQQIAAATMHFNSRGEPKLTMPSPKIDALIELIEANEDEKIVVFTQFRQVVELIVSVCEKRGISGSCIVGGQTSTERQSEIDYFVNGPGRVLLCTISAGGEAIDGLQHVSSTCVFMDRHWNPGQNQQAIARLDRDGQTSRVQVIDIMSKNTVDRGRHQQIETKASWLIELLTGNPS